MELTNYFRIAHPSRVDVRGGDHFLLADLSVVFRQNSMRTENSAIPCRDGCPIQVTLHPRAPRISRRENPGAAYMCILRMEGPRRFRDAKLVGIRRHDRTGSAAFPVAHEILSEAGWDMSKWETEDHFVSWLRLCPDNRISGDKIIGKGRLPTNNRVSIALKMAANALRTSKTYLGAQFRRLRSRLDTPVAIKAMAAKLARLVYRILRYGMKYVDRGAAFYEAQHRHQQIKHLKSKAAKLGFQIIQVQAA